MANKLRKAARGQSCKLEIHPYCSGDAQTVVFCHAPSDDHGMGIKSPDWWGADGCSSCHDVIDGRMQTDLTSEEITECVMRGIYRTIKHRIEQGLIKVE